MIDIELLIDLHAGNARQAPGGLQETLRAIELTCLDASSTLRAADIGCGTGASTLPLAQSLNARITAIDAAPAFIDRLQQRAAEEGVADTINAQVGLMESLPFAEGELDLIWSEGAIYNMGFARGVREWRRFLRPGGVLAVSELTWTSARRPGAIEAHWTREYPQIAEASANIRALEQRGYAPLGFFFLPARCWDENYYAPLRSGIESFLRRHAHSPQARAIAVGEEKEMRLYEEYGEHYGYAFYVAKSLSAEWRPAS